MRGFSTTTDGKSRHRSACASLFSTVAGALGVDRGRAWKQVTTCCINSGVDLNLWVCGRKGHMTYAPAEDDLRAGCTPRRRSDRRGGACAAAASCSASRG